MKTIETDLIGRVCQCARYTDEKTVLAEIHGVFITSGNSGNSCDYDVHVIVAIDSKLDVVDLDTLTLI